MLVKMNSSCGLMSPNVVRMAGSHRASSPRYGYRAASSHGSMSNTVARSASRSPKRRPASARSPRGAKNPNEKRGRHAATQPRDSRGRFVKRTGAAAAAKRRSKSPQRKVGRPPKKAGAGRPRSPGRPKRS